MGPVKDINNEPLTLQTSAAWRWVTILLGGAVALFVAWSIGNMMGTVRSTKRATLNDVKTLYALAGEGRSELAEELGIISEETMPRFLEQGAQYGPVVSAKVVEVYDGALGVPIFIIAEVKRKHKTVREAWVRHAVVWRGLDFVITAP